MRPITLMLALLLAACATCHAPEEPEAICDTDTDCMQHCPPPADDPDCDGGPQ